MYLLLRGSSISGMETVISQSTLLYHPTVPSHNPLHLPFHHHQSHSSFSCLPTPNLILGFSIPVGTALDS